MTYLAVNRRQRSWTMKVSTFFIDTPEMRKKIGKANFESLNRAGFRVKQAAKKGIGSASPHQSKTAKATLREPVVFRGGLYYDRTRPMGKPRASGKPVKSWAPRRFVYNDIVDYFDTGGKTVVIGTLKAPWLMRLHEFGGREKLWAFIKGPIRARRAFRARRDGKKIPRRAGGELRLGALVWTSGKASVQGRHWESTGDTRSVKFPARPFMQGAKGVQKAVAKANEEFGDSLHG